MAWDRVVTRHVFDLRNTAQKRRKVKRGPLRSELTTQTPYTNDLQIVCVTRAGPIGTSVLSNIKINIIQGSIGITEMIFPCMKPAEAAFVKTQTETHNTIEQHIIPFTFSFVNKSIISFNQSLSVFESDNKTPASGEKELINCVNGTQPNTSRLPLQVPQICHLKGYFTDLH